MQTKVQGNDCVSWCWSQLGEILRLLFEFGEEGISWLSGHTCTSSSKEAAHVMWLEQRLCLLQGENR